MVFVLFLSGHFQRINNEPDKLHRRLLLRVINLNFDKHKRAGGQDDYPMPFLFKREHTNSSSYFNGRPFGRMPTYNTERDDTGQLSYRYYCALTKRKVDAAVAKIEKEKANLQQKRAREAVRQHEAPSGAQQQSSILPRVVPSSSSSSSSSSYSASAAPLNLVAHNQMMAEVSSSSVLTGISAAEAAARRGRRSGRFGVGSAPSVRPSIRSDPIVGF